MDFFAIIIIFIVGNLVVQFFRKVGQSTKQAQTKAQIEATKRTAVPKPAPRPVSKPADFRFPPVQSTTSRQPVFVEGRADDAVVRSDLRDYQPVAPSADLNIGFSDYQGSLNAASSEGAGYTPEVFDERSAAYQGAQQAQTRILPQAFDRNTLVQAFVLSEILKRPGASRR